MLKLGVLGFQSPGILCVRGRHAAIFEFVTVESSPADIVAPACICCPLVGFLLLDHPNDLLVCETCFQLSVLSVGRLDTNMAKFQGLRSGDLSPLIDITIGATMGASLWQLKEPPQAYIQDVRLG